RRRHTRSDRDWSSDVCSSDLLFLSGDLVVGEKQLDRFGAGTGQARQPPDRRNPFPDRLLGRGGQVGEQLGVPRDLTGQPPAQGRSEERRVGKEWRGRGWTARR